MDDGENLTEQTILTGGGFYGNRPKIKGFISARTKNAIENFRLL